MNIPSSSSGRGGGLNGGGGGMRGSAVDTGADLRRAADDLMVLRLRVQLRQQQRC